MARGQGVLVLAGRASELERDFGFGVVRQLLEARRTRPSRGSARQLAVVTECGEDALDPVTGAAFRIAVGQRVQLVGFDRGEDAPPRPLVPGR